KRNPSHLGKGSDENLVKRLKRGTHEAFWSAIVKEIAHCCLHLLTLLLPPPLRALLSPPYLATMFQPSCKYSLELPPNNFTNKLATSQALLAFSECIRILSCFLNSFSSYSFETGLCIGEEKSSPFAIC